MPRTFSNLQQAIATLNQTNQKVDVSSVFATYLILAGFSSLCEEAIIAFEHALEKHPETSSTSEIRDLTTQYYTDKFGVAAVCNDSVCRHCAAAHAWEAELAAMEHEKPRSVKNKKKKNTVKARKAKTLSRSVNLHSTPDPYGASTSAILL